MVQKHLCALIALESPQLGEVGRVALVIPI